MATNITNKALALFTLSAFFAIATFVAPVAHAEDLFGSGVTDFSGYSDVGSYGGYSDVGSYGSYSDVGNYGDYSSVGSYDSGYSYVGGYGDYSYVGSSDPSYSYVGSYGNNYTNIGDYGTSYYDVTGGDYSYNPGSYVTEDYSYNPGSYAVDNYSYNPGFAVGLYEDGSRNAPVNYRQMYSVNGIQPQNNYSSNYSVGATNYNVGHQNYSVGVPAYNIAPITYTVGNPNYNVGPTYTTPSQPIIYNVNNNTNTNNNVQQPAPISQYTYTAPVQPAPTCSISLAQDGGYAQYGSHPMRLVWNVSGGMTSAYISNLGSVQGYSGSQMVYPTPGQIYTMTVTGQGGTASCQTAVYYASIAPMPTYPIINPAPIYHPIDPVYQPVQQVALTQIPYTGFDFGVVGNSIYWFALALFAISAAYLIVYFRGGAFSVLAAFGGSRSVGNRKMPVITHTEQAAPAPLKAHMPLVLKRDFVAHEEHAPVAHAAHEAHAPHTLPTAHIAPSVLTTTDTMTVLHAKHDEAPRIVISRA